MTEEPEHRPPDLDGGLDRPGQWDVRMVISVPASITLLVIGMGVAYYLLFLDLTEQLGVLADQAEEAAQSGVTASQLRNVTGGLLGSVLVVLLVFVALGILAGLALVWTVLRPIRLVSEAVAGIARGETRQSVHFRGAYEIDQLTRSFNSMVGYINSMIQERDTYLNEGIETGLLVVDVQGRVSSVSPAGLEILGVRREDVVGRTLAQIRAENPGGASNLLAFCRQTLDDEDTTTGEIEIAAQAEGQKPLSVARSVLRDAGGAPTALVYQFRDNERIESLNRLFSRTDHLAALGTFTFGLSHELRNPLGALKGTTQLLGESVGERADCLPYLNRIVREVDRLDTLVRELYDYSRSPAGTPEACDLNELADEALGGVLRGLPPERRETAHVAKDYSTRLPLVVVQRDRMMRAVANVAANAFEHMPEDGVLTLRTRTLTGHRASPAVLEVSNTGSLIAPENLDRIFEPFFSTKQGGTGLGLAIAYQIVAQNDGTLRASSENNEVRFQFILRNLGTENGGAEAARRRARRREGRS